jgi:hypothetical protein
MESEFEGMDAEHNEIERRFGYFEIDSQLFFDEGDKKFDCLNIISVTEQKKEIWFDITDFYGKE